MSRFLTLGLTLTGLLLVGCKGDPPLPELASETLRFALTPMRDEVPRELRVTLEVPAGWKRTGESTFLKNFSSGDAPGVIFGNLSVEVLVPHADDPAAARALLEQRMDKARALESTSPGLTLFEKDRGTLLQRVVARVISPRHGFVLVCVVEQSSGYSAALGDRLYEACKAAQVELTASTLPAELEAAERGKLTQCPEKTNVIFQSRARSIGPMAFGAVRAGRAFFTSGDKLEIDLANYPHEDWRAGPMPTEPGQLRLTFELFPGVDKHVVSGHYPVRGRGFVASAAARLLWGDEARAIELRVDEDSGADVVARTGDTVCGRFKFSDGTYTVQGTFVLDLVTGREGRR